MDMVYSKICDMFSAYVLVKIEMEEEEDGGVIVPKYIIRGELLLHACPFMTKMFVLPKKKIF